MSLLIRDCEYILTQNDSREIIEDGFIYVEDGVIRDVGGRGFRGEAEYVIDGRGKVAIPGLINTHTHLSMTLFRGYADDMQLKEWLETKIWPFEQRLTGEICYKGGLLGCLEMIRTGTTCFMDMYFFTEDVARAVEEAGIRGFVSHAIIDLFDEKESGDQEEAAVRTIRHVKNLKNPRISFAISPHSPYTCSEETLLKAKSLAVKEGAPLHIHLAETRREQAEYEKRFGKREVEYLEELGFLCGNVVAAHGVWLTRREIALLGDRDVKISHCPVSNMKLAEGGVAPLPEMFEEGVTVSLGTDGAASNNCLDMFDTMKVCALLHKAHRWDPTVMPAQKVLDLATRDGAKALRIFDRTGSIEVGKEADLVLVNLKTPNMMPVHDGVAVLSNLVYSAKGWNVDTCIVAGEILLEEGRFIKLSEEDVYAMAREAQRSLTMDKG